MAAMFCLVIMLISTVLLAGIEANAAVMYAAVMYAAVMYAAHNTTVKLTCTAPNSEQYNPVWYVLGPQYIPSIPSRNEDTGELIGTLIINGNRTSGTFSALCRLLNGQNMHYTTLTVGGRLPSPENVQINGSLFIKWDPPYTAINNNDTSIMHVDPHITQYTVYIIDNYTGNYMDKVNVTEETFSRNIPDVHSCPTYGVTAWNSGGEGHMSPPLPGVPKHIAAEDVDVHILPGVLHIHIHVTDPCTVRKPNTFLVTVMSTARNVITTVHHDHQREHQDAAIHIQLPQTADECNLIVNINAGNSAGMSPNTEIYIVCPTTDDSTDPATTTAHTTATAPTTTSTGSNTTSTHFSDQNQQENKDIIYIAIAATVGALVIVVTSALLPIVLWRCWRNTKAEKPVVMHHNQAYETVTRMNHSRPVTEVSTEPCPAYGVVGAYCDTVQ